MRCQSTGSLTSGDFVPGLEHSAGPGGEATTSTGSVSGNQAARASPVRHVRLCQLPRS